MDDAQKPFSRQLIIASLYAEWGYCACERGLNLQAMLAELKKNMERMEKHDPTIGS